MYLSQLAYIFGLHIKTLQSQRQALLFIMQRLSSVHLKYSCFSQSQEIQRSIFEV